MLVLTRKKDQAIVIAVGGVVLATVRVGNIRHNTVQLAFEAPPAVAIWREEIAPEPVKVVPHDIS